MTTALAAFVVACVVGALMTALMRSVAPRLGAVDQPDGYRKIHGVAIPRLGGVGVFAGFLAPIVVLLLVFPENLVVKLVLQGFSSLLAMLAGALVALLMGFRDDIRPLRAGVKLLLQTVAALIPMAGGLVIWDLSLHLVGDVHLGFWGLPLTLFWFLGCMNAINLLDGMDGLAGGVSFIVCVTMMLVGWQMGNPSGMLLVACLSGGIFGFLIFNFHPASIFLGDSGSNVIGFLIAALGIMTSRKSETAVALLVPILALGLPITDTALAIVRRWSRSLPLSAPDRQHIHHLLLSLGLSQRRAVFLIYGVCVLLCAGALLSITADRELFLLIAGAIGLLVFVCIRVLGAFSLADLRNRFARDWQSRQASNAARIELERCAHFLPHADTLDALWQGCHPVLSLLGVDEARLDLDGPAGPGPCLLWRSPSCRPDLTQAGEFWQVQLHLMDGPRRRGHLIFVGEVAGARLFAPERIELILRLCNLIAAQLPRLPEAGGKGESEG
jgi:UDP-GlcNAc:undecaprenyl-phosphate GlcNAc-1-phosphate transferase